jgi:hypothetical protein
MGIWQRWLQHPERLWLHKLFFQSHYAAGLGIGLYVLASSISGSIIVYRNELPPTFAVEWLVKLHENLLFGKTGRLVNGIGALFLTLVCLTGAVIWWPGIKNWRRSLRVSLTNTFHCSCEDGGREFRSCARPRAPNGSSTVNTVTACTVRVH